MQVILLAMEKRNVRKRNCAQQLEGLDLQIAPNVCPITQRGKCERTGQWSKNWVGHALRRWVGHTLENPEEA
jgi:hypothetical protein